MAEDDNMTASPGAVDGSDRTSAEVSDCCRLRPRKGPVARLLRRVFVYPFVRHAYRVALICLIMLAFDRLDPFGSKSAANAMFHDLMMQVGNCVGFWPEHDPLRGPGFEQTDVATSWRKDRPDGVTLVLWTDEAMSVMKEERYSDEIWPISYATHAAALYEAREMQAKAIFLDFVFLSKRVDDTWEELAEEILAFAGSRTSLFIACDIDWDGPPAFKDMIEAVAAANKKAGGTVVSFVPAILPIRPVIRDYEMWVPSGRPITGLDKEELPGGHDKRGPATQCGGAQALEWDGGGRVSMTVAPTLYAATAARPRQRPLMTPETPTMSLFWDRRSHVVTNTLFLSEGKPTSGWLNNVNDIVRGFLFDMSILSRPMSGPPMMPAHFLVFPETPMDGTLATKDLIEGRVVVIGSAQRSAADFRNTPNAAARPGALVHAVAVDNLFKFGLDYVRERKNLIGINKSTAVLVMAVLVSALAYSILVEKNPWARSCTAFVEPTRTGYRVNMLRSGSIGLVVFSVLSYLLIYYRFPPYGWFTSLMEFSFLAAPLLLTWTSARLCSVMYERWDDEAMD